VGACERHRDNAAMRRRPSQQQHGAGSAMGGVSGRAMERVEREREDKTERGGSTFIYRTKTLATMG
jgi:hypothetical protein